MRLLTAPDPTAVAIATAEAALVEAAPELVASFRAHVPYAMDIVARRLVGAAYREGLTGGPSLASWSGGKAFLPAADGGYVVTRADHHAFDRLEVTEALPTDPARLARRLIGRPEPIEAELTDATVNLALALARRPQVDEPAEDLVELWSDVDPDTRCVHFERLATDGHNLHPCGRTRLGWSIADLLAYDLEAPATAVGFIGVRRDLHVGDDLGPEFGVELDGYAVTPVHQWQLRHVVPGRYADLVADGALVPLDAQLPARATAALRTLLLADGRYVKVSLDIQVTSTRRTISVASTRNGPVLSRLLTRLLPECSDRVLLLDETAGSAMVAPDSWRRSHSPGGDGDRDLAAIVRSGLSGRLAPDEVAVPGSALYAVSPLTGGTVLAELVDRYARHRSLTATAAATRWIEEYARLLLPPVLRLATRHGIGLEVHLQNCVPTFVEGRPHRLALRDLAGMRLHPPRLAGSLRADAPLWPGSVIVTDDVDVMRSKVAYTALQAHLGELVLRLAGSHGLDEAAAWSTVRSIVDEVYAGEGPRGRDDHAFLTAPTVPHKALLRMRLAAGRGGGGDIYVRVENPLR